MIRKLQRETIDARSYFFSVHKIPEPCGAKALASFDKKKPLVEGLGIMERYYREFGGIL